MLKLGITITIGYTVYYFMAQYLQQNYGLTLDSTTIKTASGTIAILAVFSVYGILNGVSLMAKQKANMLFLAVILSGMSFVVYDLSKKAGIALPF